jgi:hypothetical protein
MRRRRPRLVDGLRGGAEALRLHELGAAIGESLNALTYGSEYLAGGKLAIPQPCPIGGCDNGPYGDLTGFRNHLLRRHPELTDRERTEACDTVRFLCRKQIAAARSAQ